MEKSYIRWGIINSTGGFLYQDEEGFYYYKPFDAEYLFGSKEYAEEYLKKMQELFNDVKKGERLNTYSDCRFDPDMKVVEVEVALKVKS